MSAPLFDLAPAGPDWEGDPLAPHADAPTPVELVARLTGPERQVRVKALIEQANAILADALAAHVDGHEVVATCLLWSGGNDSNVLAHLMREQATHAVHCNTGIGIEQTRQFVRDTAAGWGLPLIERHPPAGSTYRDYVLANGFPGPGQHYRMFQRLKERALRQVRRELVTNGRRQRVVFLAGRRRQESRRRAGTGYAAPIPAHEREDSIIWVSPLVNWTRLDLNTYRLMHPDVPLNSVSDLLHMSGECLCGSYAKEGELDQIRDWYPEIAADIEALEAETRAAGIPEPRCRWGWGATRTDDQRGPLPRGPDDHTDESGQVGRLCSSCAPPGLFTPAPAVDFAGPDTDHHTDQAEQEITMPAPRTGDNQATVRALHAVPERPITSWTADELMAMSFPEPTWAVPGLIAEGVNLLAGPPKVGKSWLSLNLGVAIASGDPALGSIDVDPGPVLYLALEDTPRRLQSRLRKVLAGRRAPAGLTVDTYCPPLPVGGAEYIAGWLDEHPGARMVVIDVFTKVRGMAPGGMSAYEADYASTEPVKQLADSYGVPVVLVHHVRKAGADDFLAEVSGTNGLAGSVDAVLVLKRGRAQADGVLHITGRDVTENDYAMTFDAETGTWRLLDGPADDHLMNDTRALIARFVRDHPDGRKPKEIADALQLNPNTIRKTCTRMAEDGQLHAGADGTYYPPKSGDTDTTVSLLSPRETEGQNRD